MYEGDNCNMDGNDNAIEDTDKIENSFTLTL